MCDCDEKELIDVIPVSTDRAITVNSKLREVLGDVEKGDKLAVAKQNEDEVVLMNYKFFV